MQTREILSGVKSGEISIEEAERFFKKEPFLEFDFAKLDTHREIRQGFPEVVFCERKADAYLADIFQRLYERYGEVFGTRASKAQYELVKKVIPDIVYDEISGILKLEREKERIGNVVVCTAGTADIPVAEEAAQTAEYFGTKVTRIYDVGVSGLHRLLYKIEEIQKANCVIAAAGMEGALPSVIGGLVENPVIAVPTAVGYGVSAGGFTALLTMLSTCANGVSVVNIGNGYGAGYLATQINRLAERNRKVD
ncbi:MAG: nickel pincer cofactor biosynthesis protein LarB [Lachnospiraceae bacterium]|nr:nickel pincer cofactor biosynthesis protein LarB [Lachnospiraceae bacterium]